MKIVLKLDTVQYRVYLKILVKSTKYSAIGRLIYKYVHILSSHKREVFSVEEPL